MSENYTKLSSSIIYSTVWQEPDATRLVWITMLALSNHLGEVHASIPGLASAARKTIPEVEMALAAFMAPDHYSRTPDNEGRRIEPIRGGWRLLNHRQYRDARDPEKERERKREWDRENRPSGTARAKAKAAQSDDSPTIVRRGPTESDPSDQIRSDQKQNHTSITDTGTDKLPTREAVTAPLVPAAGYPTAAGEAAARLNRLGLRVTSQHPALLAALAEGITPDDLVEMAQAHPGKPAPYVIAACRGQKREGAPPIAAGSGQPAPKLSHADRIGQQLAGIAAKGRALE